MRVAERATEGFASQKSNKVDDDSLIPWIVSRGILLFKYQYMSELRRERHTPMALSTESVAGLAAKALSADTLANGHCAAFGAGAAALGDCGGHCLCVG